MGGTEMDTMRMRLPLVLGLTCSLTSLLPVAWAVEEGELVRKDGRWEYVTREDPGLKHLLEKHIITQEEYDKDTRIIEERQRLSAPTAHINYGQGLNIKTGDQFFLKLRGLMQFRFVHSEYNQAWGAIGDHNNVSDGRSPLRRDTQSSTTLGTQIMRLQFLGYAFDPNFRYDVTIGADRPEGSPIATGGFTLVNAYVASWHVPYANVVVGQYKTWFNRAQIQSVANLSFTTRMIVQNAFMANAINRRDLGITILSDENKYRVNYAIGVFNGMGITLDRLSTPSAPVGSPGRVNANELMYVGRLLWKVSGNPLYGEGDILYSTVPQVDIAVGYAYNPGVNLSEPIAAVQNQVLGVSGNGRLLGAGIVDFQTWGVDFIARYRGWALQAEGYIRQQQVRGGNSTVGSATGWYAMLGHYVVPRKLEVAVRYGIFDPSTGHSHDLVKEAGVALNYSLDGTYDHRIVADFTNVTMGTGGYAAGRQTVNTQDLVTNSIRMLYQFYW